MQKYHHIAELTKLLGICKILIAEAENTNDEFGEGFSYWDAYWGIFSSRISRRVFMVASELGKDLDYVDQDGSYANDCNAFVKALEEYIKSFNENENWTVESLRALVAELPEQEE